MPKDNRTLAKSKRHPVVSIGGLLVLCCMNVTPLLAKSGGSAPTSRPVVRKKAQQPVARRKAQPASRPAKAKHRVVNCKGRKRFGRYCLGRRVGPSVEWKKVKCPHDGHSFFVKELASRWNPIKFDSDLRPYTGRYKQSERHWVCRRCGYAAWPKDFFKPYDKKKMERVLKRFRIHLTSGQIMPVQYRFRALQASYWVRKRGVPFFVNLMKHAMWTAREEGKKKLLPRYRTALRQGIELSFKRKLYKGLQKAEYRYLLAEIYRQEGKFKASLRQLEAALSALHVYKTKYKKKAKLYQVRMLERAIMQNQVKTMQKKREVFLLK